MTFLLFIALTLWTKTFQCDVYFLYFITFKIRYMSNTDIFDTEGITTCGAGKMNMWSMMMLLTLFTTTEEFRTIAIVAFVKQLVLYKEHQSTKKRRSINRWHTLFHVGKREGMVILNNLLQNHQAYGCGAYTRLDQYMLYPTLHKNHFTNFSESSSMRSIGLIAFVATSASTSI